MQRTIYSSLPFLAVAIHLAIFALKPFYPGCWPSYLDGNYYWQYPASYAAVCFISIILLRPWKIKHSIIGSLAASALFALLIAIIMTFFERYPIMTAPPILGETIIVSFWTTAVLLAYSSYCVFYKYALRNRQ